MNDSAATLQERGARGDSRRSVDGQRWGALLGGGALAVYGLSRRSPFGLALAASGGALVFASAKAGRAKATPVIHTSILINASQQEVYNFWRDLDNLALFGRHLESVTDLGDGKSKWVAVGPMGARVEWTAKILDDRPGEYISWRSLPGSDVEWTGAVSFRPATGGRGTVVEASVRYISPGGQIGHALAKLVGKNPRLLMEQDLRRLKALMETGEIPTTEGQSHGPRSVATAVARTLDPDQSFRGDVSLREVLEAKRRVS